MRTKKRVLVTAFGATVALTLQTPVSAYIVKARKAAVATAVTHHNPPSYLADAFSDAGRRVLRADRWNGWRTGADSVLADDLDSAPGLHQARVDSTLGGLDLGYLGAGTAAQGSNSSIDVASGDSAAAKATFIGGSGVGGGGGGGGGGIGGVGGGGGGSGAGGTGTGDDASGSRLAASAAGSASSDGSFAAGEFGAAPGVSTGRSSAFVAVPGVLASVDPASGTPVDTPPLAVESPEPATLLFLGAGLAGLAARRGRRSRSGRGQPATR